MGEEWGLSVKLFGKTILVVPTSKGGDAAAGVFSEPGGRNLGEEADEVIKDDKPFASSSLVTKSKETEEEETGGGRESESHELETQTVSEADAEETGDVEEQEQVHPHQEERKKMNDDESQKKEALPMTVDAKEEEEGGSEAKDNKMKKLEKPDKNKIIPCPRCNSQDTKFCYYNNYNMNQPRHFCRNCQRYWTAGGTMRNVPVGAGRRKSKSAVAEAANVNNSFYIFMLKQQQQQQCYITTEAAALHQRSMSSNRASTVLNFSNNNQGSSPAQTAGVVLVYPHTPTASTAATTMAAPTKNHFLPYYYASTNDQTREGSYYHGQGIIDVSNPPVHPVAATKYVPWTLPPTYPVNRVPQCHHQPMHLGKHMRDADNNVQVNTNQRRHKEDEEHSNRRVWVPKALRITDSPDAAANSSIWTTISASGLGFSKKEHHDHCAKKMDSSAERGFFNAFHAKETQISATVTASNTRFNDNRDAILFANPAALARSHQYKETV